MKAYYFSAADRRLRYGDNRAISVGTTHKVEGAIELCKHGLHASKAPLDALQYAPGSVLYLVTLKGTIIDGGDKVVASEREYAAEYDATELLRSFARWCALRHVESAAPYCSAADYATILKFLETGEGAEEALLAAYWASRAAEAAYEAAKEAERAAYVAAYLAARAAHWAAKGGVRAAYVFACGAAEAAYEAAEGAAEAAYWAAKGVARAAERAVISAEFDKRISEATGWKV